MWMQFAQHINVLFGNKKHLSFRCSVHDRALLDGEEVRGERVQMDLQNQISSLRWNPDKSNQSFSSQTVIYSFSDFISVWKRMDWRQVGPISSCIQGPHAYVTLTSHLRLDRPFNHQQTPAVGEDVVLILTNAHISAPDWTPMFSLLMALKAVFNGLILFEVPVRNSRIQISLQEWLW